jgi:hypothetical protein
MQMQTVTAPVSKVLKQITPISEGRVNHDQRVAVGIEWLAEPAGSRIYDPSLPL